MLLGIVSAAATALFTPKTGKELRSDLKEKTKDMIEIGKEKAENLVEDAKESYHEAEKEMKDSKPASATEHVASTAEKGEEWLNHVGNEQDLAEYPDASGTDTTGIFADHLTDLPADERYDPDFSGKEPFIVTNAFENTSSSSMTEKKADSSSDSLDTQMDKKRDSYPFAEEILDEMEKDMKERKE